MKTLHLLAFLIPPIFLSTSGAYGENPPKPTEKSFATPHGMTISVKMVAPYAQATDLQIICVFKHKASGDTYIAAMKDLDDKLGGLLSSLRNRGEFVGELGETISFVPPRGSTLAKRLLVVGLGEESSLSLNTMHHVGVIAAREAIRLRASDVSFAPVLRDQGNNKLDVGQCDRNVEEGVILAYDTDKRLQAQHLAPLFNLENWTIEAGPAFFAEVADQLPIGIETATKEIQSRLTDDYVTPRNRE
jgi:hypothetical protein